MLASLLGPTTKIHLLRRVILTGLGGGSMVQRDTCLSSAKLQTSKEFGEGVKWLRGDVQAGIPEGEASWKIEGVINVQYALRIVVRPPGGLAHHIPSFQHEENVKITTDHWGTLERELASVGGIPMPALGLAKNLRHDMQTT
ncbi:hypothetical protein H0H87_006043 [Tephrocybe sp. NHM501043]|nr:hypothetical protein H0H87_006043 [Tephrocybe sp. NHM501043]